MMKKFTLTERHLEKILEFITAIRDEASDLNTFEQAKRICEQTDNIENVLFEMENFQEIIKNYDE